MSPKDAFVMAVSALAVGLDREAHRLKAASVTMFAWSDAELLPTGNSLVLFEAAEQYALWQYGKAPKPTWVK